MAEPIPARGRVAVGIYRVLSGIARALARVYWRLEVVGVERVPVAGAFVVAPVHRSYVDFLLAGMSVGRPVRYMAKSSVFVGGPVDSFLYAMGGFPVERDTADFSAIRTCEALLAAGEPVVVFPEGRRKEGDEVVDLFDGPAFMAARQRVPIIPVGIGGSDRAMPIGKKFIYPRKVVIVIGEPIYPDVEAEGRVPRSAISALTERLRGDVQDAYDAARKLAG
jgi:1-acyl-sn-glycerol-3-phosphate acyltransferase